MVRSAAHEWLSRRARFISTAFISGRLYEIDAYPGVIEIDQTTETVHGELYLMDTRDVLQTLDEYEECSDVFPQPHEYYRKQLDVYLKGGVRITAWCYLLNKLASHYVWIQSGNYQQFCIDRQSLTSK